MVISGRPQLKVFFFFFGFAIKKYINVLQQRSGRKISPARNASVKILSKKLGS